MIRDFDSTNTTAGPENLALADWIVAGLRLLELYANGVRTL